VTEEVIEIQYLGAQGDGVGQSADQRVFVPFALPGERWQSNKNGNFTCVSPLVERAAPLCRHFSVCGGCLAQHMPDAIYRAWKISLVRQALHQHGIMFEPDDLIVTGQSGTGQSGRRRCTFSATKDRDGNVLLGYHRSRSHDLVAIEECPVLIPEIVCALPGLHNLLDLVLTPGQAARLTVLQCEQGLDVDLSGLQVENDPAKRAAIADLARELGLVRLSNQGDTIVMQAMPRIRLGEVSVPFPNATLFLQAVVESERELCARVVAAVRGARRIADLFCGAGTFTFALARRAKVRAVDGESSAIAALKAGRDSTQGLKPIDTLVRDLFREPLSRKELEPFDAVIFDPPRAGAQAQARMLAKSHVPVIVAVSCNPGTLARDLAILIEGGYRLEVLQPVDQFLYSAHVECVAVLRREVKKRGGGNGGRQS